MRVCAALSSILLAAALAAGCSSRNADLAEGAEPITGRGRGSSHGGGPAEGELPPGHPPMGGGNDAPELPPGHPPMGGGDAPALPAGHPSTDEPAAPPSTPGQPLAGGVRWTVPESFVNEAPASSMRAAQYRIPRASGDSADGQLAVFYFGPGQGGAVQDNIDRWVDQVEQPDGRPSREVARTQRREVAGMQVTVVSVSGRLGGGGGMPGMPAAPRIDDGQLLGAIVEGPNGPVFFKLTGPSRTITAARPAFDALVGSFRTGG